MIRRVENQAVVELAVDIQQVLAQPPQSRRRYQRPVDQDGPAAAARELAGNDELPFIDFDVVGSRSCSSPSGNAEKKNAPSTRNESVPWRTNDADARLPASIPMASRRIDLPALSRQ
mgnify:CR=1 FL=1